MALQPIPDDSRAWDRPPQTPYAYSWPPPVGYAYPPPSRGYYYYDAQQAHQPVPVAFAPPPPSAGHVTPVPPPLALPIPRQEHSVVPPTHPAVPPLRGLPVIADYAAVPPQPPTVVTPPPAPEPTKLASLTTPPTATLQRDALLDRLKTEVSAAMPVPAKTEDPPSRARGLADLMNPTDEMPDETANAVPLSDSTIHGGSPVTNAQSQSLVVSETLSVAEKRVENRTPRSSKHDLSVITDVETNHSKREDVKEDSEHIEENDAVRKTPADAKRKSVAESGMKNDVEAESVMEMPAICERDIDEVGVKSDSRKGDPKKMTSSPKLSDDGVKKDDDDLEMNDRSEVSVEKAMESENDNDDENTESEITRCPCGSTANSGTMIACDDCNTWQHTRCMGFRRNIEVPEKYYCHICRPEEMRPSCVAHPRYKEKNGKDRDGKERSRDFESLLSGIKPTELRKLLAADMKHKRALMRSKNEVFLRYAALVRTQFGKHRQSVAEGLAVLLDLPKVEAVEKLENAIKRMRSEKSSDELIEKRRSSASNSQDGLDTECGSARSLGNARSGTQKRARPNSLAFDSIDANGTPRIDEPLQGDALVDFDLGADGGRSMSREDRKLQQTMRLFARMEEREREKKKMRTGDSGTSPRAGQVCRLKPSRPGSQGRPTSPKTSSFITNNAEVGEENASPREHRQHLKIQERHKRDEHVEQVSSKNATKQQSSEESPKLKIEHPVPQHRSTLTSKYDSNGVREGGKREKENRSRNENRSRDRLERAAPKRKDSCSPDTANGHGHGTGRRRSLLARERSHESKRRRVGSARDTDRRTAKEAAKRDPSLGFALFVPGPSVLGSKKIPRERMSISERQWRCNEHAKLLETEGKDTERSNRKEYLLTTSREEERKRALNGGKRISPMKKRFRKPWELRTRDDESDGDDIDVDMVTSSPETRGETVAVSMVVVSEKGSLPDKGQILESTRLIVPDATKSGGEDVGKKGRNEKEVVCLKKRAVMFAKRSSAGDEKNVEVKMGISSPGKDSSSSPSTPRVPNRKESTVKNSSPTVALSPSTPRATLAKPASPGSGRGGGKPISPVLRIASPKLRSSPVAPLRSPLLRSVPPDMTKLSRSPSPVSSPGLQKPPLPTGRSRTPSPEASRKVVVPKSVVPKAVIEKAKENVGSSSAVIPKDAGKVEDSLKGHEKSGAVTSPRLSIPSPKLVIKSEVSEEGKASLEQKKGPPPCNGLRSFRSVRMTEMRKMETKSERSGKDVVKESVSDKRAASSPSGSPSSPKRSGTTISDVFQQRLQGFLKPSTPAAPVAPAAPVTPAAPATQASSSSPPSSIKGSTAKLSAALPLSSKPNLEGLRNSTGLSPRMGYARGSPSFRKEHQHHERSERPWHSMSSFSPVLKRGFGRGRGFGKFRDGHGGHGGRGGEWRVYGRWEGGRGRRGG